MPDQVDFNYEEAMHGVLEARTALERTLAIVGRLERLLSENPAAFAPLAAPTFGLRDRLVADLGALEARLGTAEKAPKAQRAAFSLGQQATIAEELGVSQGDVRALGGQ